MITLRVGTRGSALALWQARWVITELRRAHPEIDCEEVIIRTHGDVATDQSFDSSTWPAGGFVGAIEQALLKSEIDLAVHSYKDLPSIGPDGLEIVAVPPRASVHDVLVTQQPVDLEQLPAGFRIGTSSPRRRAQFQRFVNIDTVPIRGQEQQFSQEYATVRIANAVDIWFYRGTFAVVPGRLESVPQMIHPRQTRVRIRIVNRNGVATGSCAV